jgi:uncharacterized protein (DUF1800 family)
VDPLPLQPLVERVEEAFEKFKGDLEAFFADRLRRAEAEEE